MPSQTPQLELDTLGAYVLLLGWIVVDKLFVLSLSQLWGRTPVYKNIAKHVQVHHPVPSFAS